MNKRSKWKPYEFAIKVIGWIGAKKVFKTKLKAIERFEYGFQNLYWLIFTCQKLLKNQHYKFLEFFFRTEIFQKKRDFSVFNFYQELYLKFNPNALKCLVEPYKSAFTFKISYFCWNILQCSWCKLAIKKIIVRKICYFINCHQLMRTSDQLQPIFAAFCSIVRIMHFI